MLGLNDSCFAYSFSEIYKKVNKNEIYEIEYNHSKTAAIIKPDRGGSVLYVNFKTRQMKNILGDWINPGISWKSDDIALIRGSCGTGCAQSVMFIAPSTTISCPVHEFRFESLTSDMPPDFYNNNFLLIDVDKKIYICYAEENIIQIFGMPSKLQAIIHPPKGYYADEADIRHDKLRITYLNMDEKVKRVIYLLRVPLKTSKHY